MHWADSGAASQTDVSGSMMAVVYTADDGYYFPADYAVAAVSGISVSRDSDTQITVSGTPTADASITLTAPSVKSENTVAAPVITSEPGADPASPSTVTITCATNGAVIRYTTDVSDPTDTTNLNRQQYSGPFPVSGTTEVKVYAEKQGMYPSSVTVKTIVIAEAMTKKVILHHVKNDGSWGIPSDIPGGEAELTIIIKDGGVVSEGKVAMSISDGMKNSGEVEVRFVPKVENLSDITVKGPSELSGAAPISQKYKLSYKPSFKDVINIYVTWDDGKSSVAEEVKVEALPEDEVGAYKILRDGTKMYLLFHTYDICMDWLGQDDLCRGYERCFHKVWPYDINRAAQLGSHSPVPAARQQGNGPVLH
ncbi:MAG: chitobiase/beta-hexosaminidase C-terminal domain-containing protein [Anaerolineaceae bacterium]|nr:chitobiase/beta-hexosaminidase C-terminal domain-containing protein [Anaerolineaceae bacterium]